ncbi:hybrid sensor histidine kinase/response regulator [Cupriavidus pinatubonensis]|uniref:histidine kinase n=1 Tax=Cupriavidus pinatubonensis (strain JMP 134 / LMG 1197) TaxID=264198 RepID=Q46XM9_CUPPJ|nr:MULTISPECIES: hybrid sensor histidine kinase/response regulator [Cupriavidus]QYY30964.1 hybrid sensor histidine kinase/response regulator [Cupriavidus pinatubonensis]TPQ33003.1 hybrid sensor histidine kinase/response regulator [Cupriavidus pinatubonensis]
MPAPALPSHIHLNALLNRLLPRILPPPGAQLDIETRAKLMAIVHKASPSAAVAAVLLPALTILAFWNSADHAALLGWGAVMLLLLAGGLWFYLGYQRDGASMSRSAHTRKWWGNMRALAFLTGVTWGSSAVLHMYTGSAVFSSVLYLLSLGVLAGGAVSQAPVPSNLAYAGIPILVPNLLMAEIAFPGHGIYVQLLLVIYAMMLGRHALGLQGTLVRAIQLEGDSRRLAKQFQEEKERALHASEEKSRFLAAASHDLRQPVHALVMLVEALRARNQSTVLHPLVEQVAAGTQTIDLLFRSLLDLSKLEGRKVLPTLEPCELSALIRDVMSQFAADARESGLTLTPRVPDELFAMAEPVLLRRALFNLVQNALRYTKRGGVLVTARQRRKHVRLEVWDTGAGILPDHLPDIFSPYYQVHNPQRDPSQGLGLGLAIFKECVRLMRGTYGVRSVPGKGSVFWFALGTVPDETVASVREMRAMAAAEESKPDKLQGTVLVVDDDTQIRKAWIALMEAWGIRVECAAHGAEADKLFAQGFRPDIIFCDLRLPGSENGLDLLERWQNTQPQARSALLTGDLKSAALAAAEEAGYFVLPKPVDPASLRMLLRRWLRPA